MSSTKIDGPEGAACQCSNCQAIWHVAGAPYWLGVLMPLLATVDGARPAWFEIGALDASQLHIGKAPAKAAE